MRARLAIGLPAALLAAAAAASVAYNRFTPSDALAPGSLHDGPFVAVGGRRIAYRRYGAGGPAVVLISGFVEPSWVWRQVGPELGRDRDVFALDLPPFGYSERVGPYSLATWRSITIGFMDHFGISRPLLVGHSLGAAVAVAVALAEPQRTRGLVLVSGDALAFGGGPAQRAAGRLLVDPLATSAYRLVSRSDRLYERILRASLGPGSPRPTPEAVSAWQQPFRVSGTQQAFTELLRLGVQGYRLDDLAAVSVPTALIWGEHDAVVPLAQGRRVAAVMQAPLHVIPGAGHLPMLTHPHELAGAILAADRLAKG